MSAATDSAQAAWPARYRPNLSQLGAGGIAAIALIVLLGTFYFAPILRLMSFGFVAPGGGLTAEPFRQVASSDFYTFTILNTVRISVIVTAICLVLAYPVSCLLAVLKGRLFTLVLVCVMLPLWISVVVKTYAWLVILQHKGVVNSLLIAIGIIDEPLSIVFGDFAVIVASVHMMLPFMILPLYAALRRIDPNLYRAAMGLGATPGKVFVRITVPLSLPGVAAGALLVFILELGFFVTPAILGGGKVLMIAPIVQKEIDALSNWGVVAILSALLLSITLAAVILSDRLLRNPGKGR